MLETTSHLLYYVNSEGAGHWQRAQAIISHINIPTVLITEQQPQGLLLPPGHRVVSIPAIRPDGNLQVAADCLHVPLGHRQQYLPRLKAIIDVIQQYRCMFAVIDVCVETAMVMRLAGVPYAFMRMSGRRNDKAHLQAYQAAAVLLASYPEAFEEPDSPDWVKEKTIYTGGIFKQPQSGNMERAALFRIPYVLAIKGKGKSSLTAGQIKCLANRIRQYFWVGIGFEQKDCGENHTLLPFIDNPSGYIQNAAVVVANTGNNCVLEAGYFQKPLITCPEPRFFDEQVTKAKRLADLNLAIYVNKWPDRVEEWQRILQAALQLNIPLWPQILDGSGAAVAAEAIENQWSKSAKDQPIHVLQQSLHESAIAEYQ